MSLGSFWPRLSLGNLLVLSLSACSEPAPAAGDGGTELDAGLPGPDAAPDAALADPALRYQPDEPIDADNVSAFGDPLEVLDLPPPPASGFRLIAAPRDLDPGSERDVCVSWPLPPFTHANVYASRLYTTPGLHHSNVIAKPVDPDTGPQPYPRCHPDAADPFSRIGEGVIPDVLFANSTQVVDRESLVFPPGMAFRIDPTREVLSDIHFLNTTDEPMRIEVAYDFFAMPDGDLADELAPFALFINHFLVPIGETRDVGATCDVFGGRIVSLLPHTHQYATDFVVDLLAADEPPRTIYRGGGYDLDSDIATFDDPISLDGIDRIHYRCTFENTSGHDLVYGIGDNEMCILFGYLTPVRSQFVGNAATDESECLSLQLGLER